MKVCIIHNSSEPKISTMSCGDADLECVNLWHRIFHDENKGLTA